MVITFFDVTGRKQTEEALRRSQEHTRLLIESAKDYAIFTFDAERRVNSWNMGAEAVTGYTEQEIIGQLGDIIFTPEDRAKGGPVHEANKARDEGFAENERWHMRKDGSRFYGSGTVRPLFDNEGRHRGFVKIMRDLTESKQAEQALRESEERLRITLESAEMGAWDWNIINDNVTWNKQHYLMLGLEPLQDEKSPAYFLSFVHQEDKELVTSRFTTAIETAGIFQAEFRIIRADNREVRWMNGYGRAVAKDAKGSATRMVGVMYDITDCVPLCASLPKALTGRQASAVSPEYKGRSSVSGFRDTACTKH